MATRASTDPAEITAKGRAVSFSFPKRLQYFRRIFRSYLTPGTSQLTFWHETPKVNLHARTDQLGEYYMAFEQKADYRGPHDSAGVPLLDYHGRIGRQYNPIAIAQWGLGNYNAFCRTGSAEPKNKFLLAGEWLRSQLKPNSHGVWVWNHNFNWEYRTPLIAPWYSGLAQGQGISLLVRAWQATEEPRYLEAARHAFQSFCTPVADGGVSFTDDDGDIWFEEYVVEPPTHILNGFIWAAWGVYDYFLATADATAKHLFIRSVETLRKNLPSYDLGFWSLYERSGTRLPMIASPFYHRLHIVQLRVMQRLTGEAIFSSCADRWESYEASLSKRTRAVCYKAAFKLCYY